MLLKAVRDLAEGKEPPHVICEATQSDFSKLRSIKGVLPVGSDWRQVMEGLGPNDG